MVAVVLPGKHLGHVYTSGTALFLCGERESWEGWRREAGFYLGQKIWWGNRGGRAGVIIVKQELCVFNCLFLGGNRTSCGETHPAI